MIAAHDIDLYPRLAQPVHLEREKLRRLHRRLLAVIEVAGENQCVDLLLDTQIDDIDEGLTRRAADEAE
jgi:hypothetical protein